MYNQIIIELSNIEDIIVGAEISQKLTNLVDELEPNVFDSTSYNIFCENMNRIANLNFRYEIQRINNDDARINDIKQCIKWAKSEWKKIIPHKKVKKSIIIYSIIEYFFANDKILEWNNIINDYISKISSIISTLRLEIKIPEIAGYSDRKFFSDYKEGVIEGDYHKIFSFINAIEKGGHLEQFNNIFHSSLLKICFNLDRNLISKLLNNSSPIQTAFILKQFDINLLLEFFSDFYEEENVFPLLKFFFDAVHQTENLINQKKILEESIDYEKLFIILSKILKLIEHENPLHYLMNLNRLKWNKVFHSICGLTIARNIEYIGFYIECLDFSLENNRYGEGFHRLFVENNSNDTELQKVSSDISNKYYSFISQKANIYNVDRFTSYFNFLLNSAMNQIDNNDIYSERLNFLLEEINKIIHSWEFSLLISKVSDFYFLIISNLFFDFERPNGSFSKILDFLADERIIPVLKIKNVRFLKKCLENPEEIDKIEMHDDSGNILQLIINRKHKVEKNGTNA